MKFSDIISSFYSFKKASWLLQDITNNNRILRRFKRILTEYEGMTWLEIRVQRQTVIGIFVTELFSFSSIVISFVPIFVIDILIYLANIFFYLSFIHKHTQLKLDITTMYKVKWKIGWSLLLLFVFAFWNDLSPSDINCI